MIMTERSSSSFATTSRQSLKRPRDADSIEDFSLASVVYSFITSYLPLRHDPRPSPDMPPTTRSNTATASSSSAPAPSSSKRSTASASSATPPPLLPPPYLMETPPRPLKRIRLGPMQDPQPTPEHLLATYGIKTRDFAYESKLPPVLAYRRPQVLDVEDEPEGISRMGAYTHLDDGPGALLQPPTSPMRGVERSPPNGFAQSQRASSQSQRRRSLEREATEPVGEDAFSQPQRALPPPSRALPPTRKLFADYQAQFDQPTSQPRQDVTPPSSPGPLAGQSQPTDDEDLIATPLVTPNGSLLQPMDLDNEPIDVDAMMVDAPRPDVIDLTELPMAEDDYTYSQYGSPVRDALSSPRTPPPAWTGRPVGKRSPLRREEAFIGTTQLLLNHSPVTPPPPAARSPRFPVSPASTTGKRTPPVVQNGNTPHRPSPLGNGTHANSRVQVRSPPHVVLARTARFSRTPHSSAAPTPPPSTQGDAASVMRSYNLRKRGGSPELEESTKRVLRSSRASSVHPPQALAPLVAVRARSRTPAKPNSAAATVVPPTPPVSQSEARRGAQSQPLRSMPRGAFTIRSAHGAVETATSKTGRTIREKSREAQADRAEERPISGGKRVLRARKA